LVTLVQHTHPTTVWFADQREWSFFGSQIEGTVHFKFPFPIDKIFLDVMEHHAHHVDTMIPLYNLIGQQRNLEEAYPDNIVVEEFSIATVSRLLNTCQLYDFERHRWLNFQGQPTTPAIDLDKLSPQCTN
jgi:omega-6 fatty acid desaturase (delta-12 desaturase)